MQHSRSRPRAWCAGFLLLGLAWQHVHADEAALEQCRDSVRRDAAQALVVCGELAERSAATAPTQAGLALVERAGAGIALARYDEANTDLDRAANLLRDADWPEQHRLERQRGTLAFRRERLAEAAQHYGRSLEIAREHGDVTGQAQGWNDVGIVHRRSGDYAQALQAFTTSLALREQLGQVDQAAAVLNNLGNLQQDLGDYAAAAGWLQRALAAYRERDAPRQVAHVLESLGMNDQYLGRHDSARARLLEAWQAYTRHEAPRDRLRVATLLARLEARAGAAAAAQRWVDEALALTTTLQQIPTLSLLLAQAQAATDNATTASTRQALRERLGNSAQDKLAERIAAWEFLAAASEREADLGQALADLKALRTATAAQAEHAQNDRVAQWQVRLDVAGRLRQIEALREDNRTQAQQLEHERQRRRLLLALALSALVLVAAGLSMRLQRQRAAAAGQRQALQFQNERYRAAAEALRADRRRLQALADRSAEAVLLIDARGSVLAANRAAGLLLAAAPGALAGQSLSQLLGAAAEAVSREMAARENADEEQAATTLLQIEPISGQPLRAQLGLLDEAEAEEPVVWLQLQPAEAAAAPPQAASVDAPAPAAAAGANAAEPAPEALRRALVELMRATLEIWEQGTRLSRVDFAQKSGIWRVHIDDGRLRMRSLERYLSLGRLPQHPRWREVLRSAYFVLAECALDGTQRRRLEALVAGVRAQLSERALESPAGAAAPAALP